MSESQPPRRLASGATLRRRSLELDAPTEAALAKLKAHPKLQGLREAELVRRAVRVANPEALAALPTNRCLPCVRLEGKKHRACKDTLCECACRKGGGA